MLRTKYHLVAYRLVAPKKHDHAYIAAAVLLQPLCPL